MRELDERTQLIDWRVKVALLVVSLATIAALAVGATGANLVSDWRSLRREYKEILHTKATDDLGAAAARDLEVRLVQSYVPELRAVDRCMTCHAGVEDPRMIDQEQPFRTHPGRLLEIHDPDKFGCVACHQGQGRATEIADAHGHVPHWDYPLLAGEGAYTSCASCHVEADLFGATGLIAMAAAAPTARGETGDAPAVDGPSPAASLARGRTLLRQEGCLGCHVLDGKGGVLGPDLSREGEKTVHELDFSHVGHEVPRSLPAWLTEHFLNPAGVSPGTLMPAVAGGQSDADALTSYMLSRRGKHGGAYAAEGRGASGVEETGAQLYARYCVACHGGDGAAGRITDIRTPALNNPDTLAIASDDYYRHIIANGRSGSQMPAWREGRGNLSRVEIDRIVAHIRGWQPAGARLADVSARTGDPASGRAYYRGLCAGCHGLAGEGGIGNALNSPSFQAVADDRFLARSIIDGRPGTAMPAWKHLSAEAVSDLLAYLRTWQATPPSFDDVRAAMAATPPDENARIGRYLYEAQCSGCHGRDAEGGIGSTLASRDLLRVVDDAYLVRAIVDGRPTTAMPAWRHLSAADIGAIIAYLRSLDTGGRIALDDDLPIGDYAVGEVHYRTSCRVCHGDEGVGGVGPQLANPVLLDSASDGMLYHWIAHGRTGTAMKGFLASAQGPTQLSRQQIADVIAYLRHLGTRADPLVLRTGVGNPTVGATLYEGQCASCHGPNGEGASGPQLANPAFLDVASDGFLMATMTLGREGTAMAPMAMAQEGLGQLSGGDVQDLVAFIRLWEFPRTWRRTRRIAEMSSRAIDAGREHFASYCAGCHGPDGRGAVDGDGYYAPALNNPEFLHAASDGFLLATIARGRSQTPMRPFGKGGGGIVQLDAAEINDIVSFIRSWETPPAATGARHASANQRSEP